MFEKLFENMFEKRMVGENPFDWTKWVRGEDDVVRNNDSTYQKCLNIFADNIAKLPIVIKKVTDEGEVEAKEFYLYEKLKLRPNEQMNAFECIKALILMYKHYGSSGLYIQRNNKGYIENLYPVRITRFIVDDAGLIASTKQNKILVEFKCGEIYGTCFDKDIIILRDNSFDGVKFKATRSTIEDVLESNTRALDGAAVPAITYQTSLFKSGLTNKAVVQLSSDIKDEKELRKTQAKFERMYSTNGRVFTVPAGYSITPLNLSLADSQFAELKIIGKKEIASAVGIPFSQIEKGTLDESETIALLNNLMPAIVTLEQELDWKVLSETDRKKNLKARVNINAMLRTTPLQQSTIIDKYIRCGAYTLNDAKRLLGVKLVKGGDTVTLPSGQITLENLINGTATWQKQPAKGGE